MYRRISYVCITSLSLSILFSENSVGSTVNSSFLCVADRATGFYHYDDDGWMSADFDVADAKFVLRPLSDKEMSGYKKLNKLTNSDDSPTHGRFKLGGNNPSMYCSARTTTLFCNLHATFGELKFDALSLRYQETYFGNYWVGGDDNDNTPSITIGRCTKTD